MTPEHRCGVRGFAESGDQCPGCIAGGRVAASDSPAGDAVGKRNATAPDVPSREESSSFSSVETLLKEMQKMLDEMHREGVNGWPNTIAGWISSLDALRQEQAHEVERLTTRIADANRLQQLTVNNEIEWMRKHSAAEARADAAEATLAKLYDTAKCDCPADYGKYPGDPHRHNDWCPASDRYVPAIIKLKVVEAERDHAREELATVGHDLDAAMEVAKRFKAEAERVREELATLRAYRDRNITLGLELGQILGPDYDGVNLRDVARELATLKADVASITRQAFDMQASRDYNRDGREVAELELARLQPYVQHRATCDAHFIVPGTRSTSRPCSCGLLSPSQKDKR